MTNQKIKKNKTKPKKTEDDIPQTKVKKYLKFLEEFKTACGMDTWEIQLYTNYCYNMGDNLAHSDYNHMEKECQISLSKELAQYDDKKVLNILLHELIHTRVGYANSLAQGAIDLQEELLVNDITKGFEILTGFEFE